MPSTYLTLFMLLNPAQLQQQSYIICSSQMQKCFRAAINNTMKWGTWYGLIPIAVVVRQEKIIYPRKIKQPNKEKQINFHGFV